MAGKTRRRHGPVGRTGAGLLDQGEHERGKAGQGQPGCPAGQTGKQRKPPRKPQMLWQVRTFGNNGNNAHIWPLLLPGTPVRPTQDIAGAAWRNQGGGTAPRRGLAQG